MSKETRDAIASAACTKAANALQELANLLQTQYCPMDHTCDCCANWSASIWTCQQHVGLVDTEDYAPSGQTAIAIAVPDILETTRWQLRTGPRFGCANWEPRNK